MDHSGRGGGGRGGGGVVYFVYLNHELYTHKSVIYALDRSD